MEIKIDKIIRSRRRTLALQITPDARLIVRAPKRASLDYIKKTVFKKRLWIKEKQKIMQKRCQDIVVREFKEGEEFLYLGNQYRLSVVEGARPLSFDDGFKLSDIYRNKAKELFADWYKKKAFEKISERVQWYAALFGLSHKSIKITDAQKRWGSCSVEDKLCFSWRLIMAPLGVIDYVVVHELAHLKVKNHSKKFWTQVEVMMPDYKQHLKWLKNNDHLLSF
ncbi:MAG: M48 family metallopeptidase [Candidatus Omnitrophota bacterium]|nr:MAG: M48 family metallopeptidase [Candidatus Omnitrophota bacterium]